MGIYIKGMNMPPEGLQEIILLTHDKAMVNSNRAWKGYKEFETIFIPEHGDLIDAQEQMHLMQSCEYDTYDDYIRAFDMLDNAPTIIPADPKEDK